MRNLVEQLRHALSNLRWVILQRIICWCILAYTWILSNFPNLKNVFASALAMKTSFFNGLIAPHYHECNYMTPLLHFVLAAPTSSTKFSLILFFPASVSLAPPPHFMQVKAHWISHNSSRLRDSRKSAFDTGKTTANQNFCAGRHRSSTTQRSGTEGVET